MLSVNMVDKPNEILKKWFCPEKVDGVFTILLRLEKRQHNMHGHGLQTK